MLFNSFDFLIFFPTVTILLFILPKRIKPFFLLCASYYFYMSWNAKYLALILITTLLTYLTAIILSNSTNRKSRKTVMWLGIGINLLILFVFKYFDFVIGNLNRITSSFGRSIDNPLDLILPVGISFYTFQAIGYVIDVYRGDVEAERNIINYALFVSFFPQLVAGPIERSKNLLSQIKNISKQNLFSYENLVSGFGTILWGLFMKMVIADRAAILVDQVFDYYFLYGSTELALAAILFSIQIYADFAGYSYVAIGAARIMGIQLMENFNTPYFSKGITDFWSRWHISLSTWFRDYVYIPLGGNRKGNTRKYINLMITFLVSGLWHGASWHFVFWGALHGIFRILEEITKPINFKICKRLEITQSAFSYRLGQSMVSTFLVVNAWVFFRNQSLHNAIGYITRMYTRFNPWVLSDGSLFHLGLDSLEMQILTIALLLLLFTSYIRYKKGTEIGPFLANQNLWFRWAFYIILIIAILVFGEYGSVFSSANFIYFDF